jgi:hypothetical protein
MRGANLAIGAAREFGTPQPFGQKHEQHHNQKHDQERAVRTVEARAQSVTDGQPESRNGKADADLAAALRRKG